MRIAIDIDSTLHHYWDVLSDAARRRFGIDLPYEEQFDWGITRLKPKQLEVCIAETHTDEAILADLDFHRAILVAAGNDLLLQMGKLIGVGLLVSYRLSPDQYTLFVGRHLEVLEAIRRRRSSNARKAMERLLGETRGYLDAHSVRDADDRSG